MGTEAVREEVGPWDVAFYESDVQRAVAIAAPVFRAHGWGWGSDSRVPSVGEMEKTIRVLLADCLDGQRAKGPGDYYAATGRFMVASELSAGCLSVEIALDLTHRAAMVEGDET